MYKIIKMRVQKRNVRRIKLLFSKKFYLQIVGVLDGRVVAVERGRACVCAVDVEVAGHSLMLFIFLVFRVCHIYSSALSMGKRRGNIRKSIRRPSVLNFYDLYSIVNCM